MSLLQDCLVHVLVSALSLSSGKAETGLCAVNMMPFPASVQSQCEAGACMTSMPGTNACTNVCTCLQQAPFCAGLVHHHALYAIGIKSDMGFSNSDADSAGDLPEHAAVLYKYKFNFNRWECSRLPDNPAFSTSSLLAAYRDEVFMFGKHFFPFFPLHSKSAFFCAPLYIRSVAGWLPL